MTALSLIQDGLVAFVKRECLTCALIEPQMREVARKLPQFQVVSQDGPRFPAGVDRLVERKLKVRRYAKPTNAKVAPEEVIQKVVTEADVVLIALSD